MRRPRIHIFLLVLICSNYCSGQINLTGTWEGVMGKVIFQKNSGQFLQINIIQQGDQICGYTYDSVISRGNDHCKAVFDGHYDKKRDLWVLTGVSFIENSGSHVFMRIKLWSEKRSGRDKIEAEVGLKSEPDYDEGRSGGFLENFFNRFGLGDPRQPTSVEYIQLRKVNTNEPVLPTGFIPCFPNLKKAKDTAGVVKKEQPRSPDTIAIKKDTAKNIVSAPPEVRKVDTVAALAKKITERKNIVFGHLPITVGHITLNIYDNATYDGDSVSVFYNSKLLVNHQELSTKPIVIELDLDKNSHKHEILLYAHNLGSIPPNTALVIVYAGDKRYELHSSASLEENAVLIIDN